MVKCEMADGRLIIEDPDIDSKEDCELYEDGLCSVNDYKICTGKGK